MLFRKDKKQTKKLYNEITFGEHKVSIGLGYDNTCLVLKSEDKEITAKVKKEYSASSEMYARYTLATLEEKCLEELGINLIKDLKYRATREKLIKQFTPILN